MLLTTIVFDRQVASHLDIQPLVDITCRSIAQIMSATEAAQELRHKFGLEDPPPNIECTCGMCIVLIRLSTVVICMTDIICEYTSRDPQRDEWL